MKKSKSGFTIVELLIVVVVIAILASISVVAFRGVSTRAQAAAIISDLEATEKALRIYSIQHGGGWLRDNAAELDGEGNPYIYDIIDAQPDFKALLSKAPTTNGLNTTEGWFYDNDGDAYSGACTFNNSGVNLMINYFSNPALLQAIDDAADDGNLACGRVRAYGSSIFVYNIE